MTWRFLRHATAPCVLPDIVFSRCKFAPIFPAKAPLCVLFSPHYDCFSHTVKALIVFTQPKASPKPHRRRRFYPNSLFFTPFGSVWPFLRHFTPFRPVLEALAAFKRFAAPKQPFIALPQAFGRFCSHKAALAAFLRFSEASSPFFHSIRRILRGFQRFYPYHRVSGAFSQLVGAHFLRRLSLPSYGFLPPSHSFSPPTPPFHPQIHKNRFFLASATQNSTLAPLFRFEREEAALVPRFARLAPFFAPSVRMTALRPVCPPPSSRFAHLAPISRRRALHDPPDPFRGRLRLFCAARRRSYPSAHSPAQRRPQGGLSPSDNPPMPNGPPHASAPPPRFHTQPLGSFAAYFCVFCPFTTFTPKRTSSYCFFTFFTTF